MKRALASLLAVTAALSLAGCGSSSNATAGRQSAGAQAACVKPAGNATTAASATASATTATTRSAPGAGPAAEKVIAFGNASGQQPCARAAGTVHGPASITLRGTSEPPQGATVSWKLSCEKENGAAAGTGSGQKALAMPGSQAIALPSASPAKCVVSAAARLDGSGNVHVSIVTPHKPS